MLMYRASMVAVTAFAVACGGSQSRSVEHPKPGLAAAELPYQIVDARTGHAVDEAAFWASVVGARAVCVGEEHPNPHHHWVQLHVVQELVRRLPQGTTLGLGMEMFQRPFQAELDDYAAKRIDAAALRERSGWEARWGYDYGFYGPTIDAVVAAGGQLVALNAAKELTKKVSHHGLESLTAEERAQVPELDLHDAAHRAWFDALMEEMGGSSAHSKKPEPAGKSAAAAKATPEPDEPAEEMPSADRIYTVQVMWDETMADTAAKWLAAHPTGHLVILAGTGHCHDSAIVHRLQRRGIASVISLRSVIEDGEGSLAEVLAKPMNDFIVVLQMPK